MSRIDYEGWNPPHLSYSTIDGFRFCGQRTLLQKVLRKEQRPGLAGMGGNAVHEATAVFDKDEQGEFSVEEIFLQCWNDQVAERKEQSPSYELEDYIITGKAAAKYDGKRNVDWWLDNGPLMVQRWLDWREDHSWRTWETPEGVPAVEIEIRIELPTVGPVLMYLDRVMVTPVGQITVVDIKTGRLPETAEQLGFYATGLQLKYGEMFRPDWGYYWDAQKGTHGSPLDLSMYTVEYLDHVAAQMVAGANAGAFLAKPQMGCHRWCGVSKFCSAVGGNPNA